MAERYELFLGTNRQHYFRLVAPNNEIILQSEGYVSMQGAENGIASCKAHSPYDKYYSRLTNGRNAPYFTLKASNGQVIGVSEAYSSVQARDKGIEAVKRYGPTAQVLKKAG